MELETYRKGPSRKECEMAIRRILMTEVLEEGRNRHFKTAADFMRYFESLYPASSGLTKQVQRAVKALDMPRDEEGYFIINKTKEQLAQDNALAEMMKKTNAVLREGKSYESVFLSAEPKYRAWLLQMISESETFRGKYITILDSTDGLLFLTENASQLRVLLDSLNRD